MQVKELEAHERHVVGLAFSPNGRRLASGAQGEAFIQLWNAVTLEPEARIPIKSDEHTPASLQFSPDSRYLSARLGRRVMIWEAGPRRLRFDSRISLYCEAESVTFSGDGKTVYGLNVSASPWNSDFGIDLWARPVVDLRFIEPLDCPKPERWPIFSEVMPCPCWHDAAIVGAAADGTVLVHCFLGMLDSGPWEKSRKLAFRLSMSTGEVTRLDPKAFPLTVAAVSPDGRRLVVSPGAGRLSCLDLMVEPPQELWRRKVEGGKRIEMVTFASGNGQALAVADVAGVVRVLEGEGGAEISAFAWGQGKAKPRARVGVLALSPEGETLAIGGNRPQITVIEHAGS